jgi:hypothetical protein
MTFRPSAPHKKPRWLALFAVVVVAGGAMLVAPAAAHFADAIDPTSFIEDDLGANDEPGQKDLTAQASAFHDGAFYTAWKWDDTSWSGGNTGDGCALFTNDADDNANVVICATIGGAPAQLQTITVYSCSDKRDERCTNPVLRGTLTSSLSTYCQLTNPADGQFDSADTQIVCNVTAIVAAVNLSAGTLTLTNSCSYPSQEPNSDPSDCVLQEPAPVAVTVSTDSRGSAITTWSATLNDTASISGGGTGSISFALYSDSSCTTLVAGSGNTDSTAPYNSLDVVIDNTDVTGNGPWTFYWKVTYAPDAGFTGPAQPLCGEAVVITASAVGSTSP